MSRFVSALPGYWESLKWLLTHGTRSDSEEETYEEPPKKRRRKNVDEHYFEIPKFSEHEASKNRLQRLLGQDSSDDFLLSLKDRTFSQTMRNTRRKSLLETSSSTPNSRGFGNLRLSMGNENVIGTQEEEKTEKREVSKGEEVSIKDGEEPKLGTDSKLLKDLHKVVENSTPQCQGSWVDIRTSSKVIERRDPSADKENDLEVVKVVAPVFLEKKSNPSISPQNMLNVASRPLTRSVEKMQTTLNLKRPNSGSLSSISTGNPSFSATSRKLQLLDESIRLDERKIYSQLLQNFTKIPVVKYPSRPERVRKERLISLSSISPARKKANSNVEVIDLTKVQDGTTKQRRIERKDIPALMSPAPSSVLRQKLDKCNVYDVTWMTELTKAYRRKDRENQKKILEEKVKTALATKRSEQMLNEILEERVRVHLRLSDVAVEEGPMPVAEEEVSLPELTPVMEKKIAYVFKSGPGNEVIVDKFSLRITRRDMHTLVGTNWLNDEVINFYMNLLIERGKQDNYPSVYCFNTFFYPKLASQGHASLKRWTRKIDVFANEMLMIPVHLGVHWCLATINFKEKKIRYYDSMGGSNNTCLQNLMRYLQDECLDKKKTRFDTLDWALENVQDNPQQMNGSDCGMFSCMYAEYLCRRAKINFSQSDMPYFRRKMAYEILTARLLL